MVPFAQNTQTLKLVADVYKRQHLAHRAAEAANDVVLLGGDDGAGFLGCLDDDLLIDGLDGMNVDCLLYTSRCV